MRKQHDLVSFLFEEAEFRGWSRRRLADIAGINHMTLRGWQRGHTGPTVRILDQALHAIGYKLAAIPMTEAEEMEWLNADNGPDPRWLSPDGTLDRRAA